MNSPEIVVVGADQGPLDELVRKCKAFPNITVQKVDRVLYTHPPTGMDALFLVLPAAEKWGAKPLPGKAQVLKTDSEDQRNGMPRYVVTGVLLRPSDPRGAIPETKLLIMSALEAVREFNRAGGGENI